jgi:hypothetical protein
MYISPWIRIEWVVQGCYLHIYRIYKLCPSCLIRAWQLFSLMFTKVPMPYLWLVHCLLFHHFMKLLKYKQILLIYKFIYCTICFQLSFKLKLNFRWITSPKHYPILSIHPTECIGLIHPIHGGWLFLAFRSDMQFPEYNFLKSYKGVAWALAFQVDLSVWTFYQSDFCEETCKQYEEKTCNRRGYCNFMHLKNKFKVDAPLLVF